MREGHRHRPDEDKKEERGMNRRDILKMAGAILAGGVVAKGAVDAITNREKALQTADKPKDIALVETRSEYLKKEENTPEAKPEPAPEIKSEENVYDTRVLQRFEFSNLYTTYLGIAGRPGENTQIDFNYQLQEMWKTKKNISKGALKISETGDALRKEFAAGEKGLLKNGIEDYINLANNAIEEIKKHLDFKKLSHLKGFDQDQAAAAKEICMSVTGKDLLAYAMTEIMPSDSGWKNKLVMDFLLKNAGRQYIESIPAMHDSKLSFGPYQLTEYVVYPDWHKKGGAMEINYLLPFGQQIPNHLEELRSQDHHKAAYLFMVENLSHLIKNLRGKELANFRTSAHNKADLISYIAAAHHKPHEALPKAARWLREKLYMPLRQFFEKEDPKVLVKGKLVNNKGGLGEYAKKTEANLHALYNKENLISYNYGHT